MKFDLVDPPEDSEGAAHQPPFPFSAGRPQEQAPPPATPELGDALLLPVSERMGTAVEGVRASLDELRARVADKSMAEAARSAARAPEVDAESAFHPHRFTARPQAGER